MKFVFLDVDGVLNSERSVFAKIGELNEHAIALDKDFGLPYGVRFNLACLDPVAVGLVNRLTRKSGAKIVLSSTHRSHFDDAGFGSPDHVFALNRYGKAMGLEAEIFGVTPKLHTIRGHEVEHYLNEHEPEAYVIIDDSVDFLPGQKFVRVDSAVGFAAKDYYNACRFLGAEESPIIT